jgi:hypothetical protein
MTKSMMRNKAPCPPAILIAMTVRQCNTKRIAQCSMPRATPEATGRRHRVRNNQQNDNAKHTYFAGHFDGHCDSPVRYREHRPLEEVCSFQRSH